MQKVIEKRWIVLGLILAGVVFSIMAVYNEKLAGGADNYAHFNISRWAFRYPHLFLNHWGKPIFTILTAPFAQIGLIGVRIFNVLCGLCTAWFSYRLIRYLEFENAWFVIFAVVFTPIYFVLLFSGMTEILFSFFLLVSIFLFFKEKYIYSAFLVSFIFLVRTEGIIFIPLFLLGFFLKQEYKAIPFLLTGFLLYSVIGWIYYHYDFWWLINNRPYVIGGTYVYGSGTWFHFFKKMPFYFGTIISVLIFAGSTVLVVKWIKERLNFKSSTFFKVLLILGCFWGYFFAHVYLWWQTESSAGLVRVMAGISPLAAVISIFALNALSKTKIPKLIYTILIGLLALFLVWNGVAFYKHTVKTDINHEVLTRTTQWLKDSKNLQHKLVIHDPYFAYSTGIDAWDNNVVQYGFRNNDFSEYGLPDSTIFVWDAHFSAKEGHMPLNKMLDNPNFAPIKSFEPFLPFSETDENGFKIVIFRKVGNPGKQGRQIPETIKKEAFGENVICSQIYRFEQSFSDVNVENSRRKHCDNSTGTVYSLDGVEFSPAFVLSKTEVKEWKGLKVKLTADFKCREPIDSNKLLMVFSMEVNNRSYHYEKRDIYAKISGVGSWSNQEFNFKVPAKTKRGTELKAYIWNINKNDVLLDNLKIELVK